MLIDVYLQTQRRGYAGKEEDIKKNQWGYMDSLVWLEGDSLLREKPT